jgi:hypothetical protein
MNQSRPAPIPKNYSILNPNDSDSSSDDELIPITDESIDQLVSPNVQVSCSSSSTAVEGKA